MRLLHGSNVDISEIDLSKCKSHNDFGRGFYLTPSWQRAWQMGRRRKLNGGGEIIVNSYIFLSDQARSRNLKILKFSGFTISWVKFVIKNRESSTNEHQYDIVIGPVADAVFDVELAKYKKEFGNQYMKDENLKVFIKRISQFGINYIQYCFCTKEATDILIKE